MLKFGNVSKCVNWAKANLMTQLIHMILIFLEGKEKDLCADFEKV